MNTQSLPRPKHLRRYTILSAVVTYCLVSPGVFAQSPPPPPAPAFVEEQEDPAERASPEKSDEPKAIQKPEVSASDLEEAASEPESSSFETPLDEDLKASAMATTATPASESSNSDFDKWWRTYQMRSGNSLSGSTGLLRVHEAGSGPVWSFRFQMLGGYMGKRTFLCSPDYPCELPADGSLVSGDSVRDGEGDFSLSVTPSTFLEVFANLRSTSTSNNAGEPQVLQVLGDISFGAKAFTPYVLGRIWAVGAEVDIALKSGSGGVGFDAAATSPSFRALASFDFNNRKEESQRFPLRIHSNLGFRVNNTGKIVDQFEINELNGTAINRISRYGLGIAKVNFFNFAVGAEYTNPWVRPFVEFSVDIASNYLKGYECNSPNIGESCLFNESSLGYMPSRLTLGAHAYPWQDSGLNLLAAIDIGTGGARRFIDEVKPESVYKLWFGVSYAVDPLAPKEIQIIEVPIANVYRPEPRRYVLGRVLDEKTDEVVTSAILKYQDINMTGLVVNDAGLFVSQDLPPGEYSWEVIAEGYREGECKVVIEDESPQSIGDEPLETALLEEFPESASELESEMQMDPEPEFNNPESSAENSDDEAAVAEVTFPTVPYLDGKNMIFPVECKLKELPKVATINGLLVDSTSGGTVLDARVVITDKLERSLELLVDPDGSFQFRNVPFGTSRIVAHAPGYLSTVSPILLEDRKDREVHLVMNPRPSILSVQLSAENDRIILGKKLHFVAEGSEVAVDSMIVIEEIALLLEEHPEISALEVIVHTDNVGSATINRSLSQVRAEVVKARLLQIASSSQVSIRARGAGPDEPLTANTSEEARDANERVEFNITVDKTLER